MDDDFQYFVHPTCPHCRAALSEVSGFYECTTCEFYPLTITG